MGLALCSACCEVGEKTARGPIGDELNLLDCKVARLDAHKQALNPATCGVSVSI